MSSPFGGSKPAIIPFSTTCDANGNATITLRPRAAFWWAGKAVGKVSGGSPVWEAAMGGIFSGTGRGQRAEIAGLIVAPGDQIVLSVLGAIAKAAVTGSLIGTQGATMEDVADAFSPNPNTISTDVATAQVLVGTVTAPTGGTKSQSFPLPPGTVSLGYVPNFNAGGVLPSQANITGDQTGSAYRQDSNPSAFPPIKTAQRAVEDTSVTLAVTSPGVTFSTVDLLAWTIPVYMTVTPDVAAAFPVTSVGSQPAFWQTFPNSTHMDVTSSGADILVQNPVGLGSHQLILGPMTWFSGAAARMAVKDASGGTVIAVLVFPAANVAPAVMPFNGRGLGFGDGVFVNTGNGNEVELTLQWNNN